MIEELPSDEGGKRRNKKRKEKGKRSMNDLLR
jgi:hypothetical protein